jgi:HEAT repeat protein
VLAAALSDPEPLVRAHAVCALGEIGSVEANAALEVLKQLERDPFVRDELEAALVRSRPSKAR